jgi:branched-chain amino acid transport system substrate-binding protein
MVSSSADAITQGDTQGYIWRFQMRATDWGTIIGRAATKMGFKSVAMMGLQNAFVMPMQSTFHAQLQSSGRKVVDSVIYNPEQPSYRAEVERVFSKKPDAVFCFALLPDFVGIMKEVYRGGFESKVVSLSVAADAEGKFVAAVGEKAAEGVRHFQPMPDLESAGYKDFLKLMGAPANRVMLFPPNTHDQLAVTVLAMEKAQSPIAADWSKQIVPVCTGTGKEVTDVAEGLRLLRAGTAINFQGAGATCQFTSAGDQLERGMGEWVIRKGANQFVQYVKA